MGTYKEGYQELDKVEKDILSNNTARIYELCKSLQDMINFWQLNDVCSS